MKSTFQFGSHSLHIETDVPRVVGDTASVQIKLVSHPMRLPTMGSSQTPEENVVGDSFSSGDGEIVTYYGPHACGICGALICKAARDQGGAEYDYPEGPIYPNTKWQPHTHKGYGLPSDQIVAEMTMPPSHARAVASALLSAATDTRSR